MTDNHLSQNEIDELLNEVNDNSTDTEDKTEITKIKIYDFKRHPKFLKSQIHYFSLLHAEMAHHLEKVLSGYLGTSVELQITAADQLTSGEFGHVVPEHSVLGFIRLKPLDSFIVWAIDPLMVFVMIDLACGGNGAAPKYARDLMEMETAIIKKIFMTLLPCFQKAWNRLLPVEPVFHSIESKFRNINMLNPAEMLINFSLTVKINETEGGMSIGLPDSLIQSLFQRFRSKESYQNNIKEERKEEAFIQRVSNLKYQKTDRFICDKYCLNDIFDFHDGQKIDVDGATPGIYKYRPLNLESR